MAKQYTFEADKTYLAYIAYSSSSRNNEVPWLFKVVRRTAKMVWMQDEDGAVRGYRIHHISTVNGSMIEVVHHKLFGNILARNIANA